MCIIATKPMGVALPDYDLFRTMWNNNSDGAGFMYVENGAVRIEKGFMKYKHFTKALNKVAQRIDTTKTAMVFHFRITTHGGTKAENTHPFPISDRVGVLSKRKLSTDVGVAHNGIIDCVVPRKGISDTMEYIASQLAPLKRAVPEFYKSKDLMLMVENAIESKMAFLASDGSIYTIGEFNEHDGMYFSNYSYEKYSSRYGSYNWMKYYSEWYDDDGNYTGGYTGATTPSLASKIADSCEPDYSDASATAEYDDGCIIGAFLTDDCYVVTDSGMLEDPADFILSDDDKIYEYDYTTDMAVYRPGYTALSYTGLPARYDIDNEAVYYAKH